MISGDIKMQNGAIEVLTYAERHMRLDHVESGSLRDARLTIPLSKSRDIIVAFRDGVTRMTAHVILSTGGWTQKGTRIASIRINDPEGEIPYLSAYDPEEERQRVIAIIHQKLFEVATKASIIKIARDYCKTPKLSGGVRDQQRQKFYRWEEAHSRVYDRQTMMIDHPSRTWTGRDDLRPNSVMPHNQIEEYCNAVREEFLGFKVPKRITVNFRKQDGACCQFNGDLTFSRDSYSMRLVRIVLHELAHNIVHLLYSFRDRLEHNVASHGAEFVAVYCMLLDRFTTFDRDALRVSALDAGLRVAPFGVIEERIRMKKEQF